MTQHVHHADYADYIKDLSDGSIDMILTDPPYEISDKGGGMMKQKGREYLNEVEALGLCDGTFNVFEYLHSVMRLFKPNCFNGVFFCSLKQIHQYIAFAIQHNMQYGITMWHKSDPAPLCNSKYLNDVEWCIFIKQSGKKIKGSYHSKSLVYHSSTNRKEKKMYGHPTVKPVDLLKKYLTNHSDEGDTVLDTFLGTGSTLVACKELNRNGIGVEIDEHFYEVAKQRVAKA